MTSGDSAPDRRVKSALFLLGCLWAGMAPHWLAPDQRLIPSFALALLLGGYSIRTVLLQALRRQKAAATEGAAAEPSAQELPSVDVVVAARDEELVIARLVERIARIRYPEGRLCLWVIDDGSEDATPALLRELETTTPRLRVLRRSRDAGVASPVPSTMFSGTWRAAGCWCSMPMRAWRPTCWSG